MCLGLSPCVSIVPLLVFEVVFPVPRTLLDIPDRQQAGREQVNEGGVVRDPAVRKAVVESVVAGVCALGFVCRGHTASPIRGASKGNHEYLAYFARN